ATEVTTTLLEWARHWDDRRPLLLPNVAPDTALATQAARSFAVVDEHRCPSATVPPGASFDDVLATWTKNRRKSIRKKLAHFADAGGTFRWIAQPAEAVASLPQLFELHDRRRSALGRSSSFAATEANRAFHRRIASYADSHSGCWIQLATVR